MADYDTKHVPEDADVIAPDGSEIRFLPVLDGGSMVDCRLQPGSVTKAIRHQTVEELWYVIGGEGDIWRKQEDRESITTLKTGTTISLPLGTHFQFRCTSDTPLQIVIVTMPPWPGADEAVRVEDYWSPTV